MEKRTLLALAISFVVLGFYPLILEKFYPGHYKKTSAPAPASSPEAPPPAAGTAEKLVKAGAFSPDEDLSFQRTPLSLVFNKKDGGIREIAFPSFPDSETSRPIKFLSLKSIGVSPGSLLVSSGPDASLVTDFSGQTGAGGAVLSAGALAGALSLT
jgi:hypothetical protein